MNRTNEDPKNQIRSAFSENLRHVNLDPGNDTWTIPVGSYQSKAAKLEDRLKFRGLDISVENAAGSTREWYDPHNDTHGKTKMLYPYGYIRMSEGMDGDHVDCYVGPNENAENVYVITTKKSPAFKVDDEQKCMLGFDSEDAAKQAFLKHFTDDRFFGSMKTLKFDDFKAKVLATRQHESKKIGSTLAVLSAPPVDQQMAYNYEDKVPGDRTGLPMSSLVGLRTVPGTAMDPKDRIDRMFRGMDQDDGVRVTDGGAGELPSGPVM